MSLSSSLGEALELRRPPRSRSSAAARMLDLAVVVILLVVFAPLMLLVAAAIVGESGRPIFFSQTRLGRRGRHFRMHKFRKFHERAGSIGRPLTMEDDPRLTRVGSLLARTKLDELPQLWNVLKGDMSLVGPRPESLDFADCFTGPYRAVLDHKPGIFGPSQVLFRNEASLYRGCADPEQFYREFQFPLKARIDLAYFTQRTLLRDIAWIARGALAVFGCASVLRKAAILAEEMKDRSREDCDLPVQTGLPIRVVRRGMVEMAAPDESRIALARPEA